MIGMNTIDVNTAGNSITTPTDLHAGILACTKCPTILSKQEPGHGPVPPTIGARYRPGGIAALCDAPKFYEAQSRAPLMGRDGQLATRLMEAAGVPRAFFLLDNSVRCKAPNNRTRDYPEAIAACADWTNEVFRAYDPAVIVLMGAMAIQSVFGADARVSSSRGMLNSTPAKHPWGHRVVICTWHPAAAGYAGGENSEPGQQIIADLRRAVVAWKTLAAK